MGKSTLIRSLVKFYTKQNLTEIKGPITVVAGTKPFPPPLPAVCAAGTPSASHAQGVSAHLALDGATQAANAG